MALGDYIVTDGLTIVLGLVAAGLFLLHNCYKPQSLVHPILLGRQSDVARVRDPGKSAVYRNYGTGMQGRFPLRPSKDQHVLLDLVNLALDAPRTLWATKITNPQLKERAMAFGNGLTRVAGLVPKESHVLLLLNDGVEFLISDLALATYAITSLTLSNLSLLSSVLDNYHPSAIITHAEFIPDLLELLYDSNEGFHPTIIVIREYTAKKVPGVTIIDWADIEREGALGEATVPPTPVDKDVFTVSFSATSSGDIQGTSFTHENLTAGVAATRALLPLSGAISPLDTIISAFPMSTPFGRAVAYTAVYEGASFATLTSTKLIPAEGDTSWPPRADISSVNIPPIPSPTLLVVRPSHLKALTQSILDEAKKSFLSYSFSWRHKVSGILEGYITKQSLWDRLTFDTARVNVLGKGAGTVRALIVAGEPLEAQELMPARVALSVPIVNTHIHTSVAGPIFASHPLDLQTFAIPPASSPGSASDNYAFTYLAAVGPPTVNVEAKLVHIDDAAVESGEDPCGDLYVRGPSVGEPIAIREVSEEEEPDWLRTGQRAKVLTNGAFKVASGKVI